MLRDIESNPSRFGNPSRVWINERWYYLAQPVLGARLRACGRLTLAVENKTAREVFGSIDAVKFRSSMTLFARAAPDEELFQRCLDKYFAGDPDAATLARL